MGTWGTSPFENDNAADFMLELARAIPADRPALVRQRLALVASGPAADRYVEAPEADDALAAVALLVLATGQSLHLQSAPADADTQDLARTLPPPDVATRELAATALARIVTDGRSEWLELWDEAGETEAARTRVLDLARCLAALDPGPSAPWEQDAPVAPPAPARRRWWRR